MPRRKGTKSKRKRLQVAAHGVAQGTIPTRWVKFVVALFLLPPAWILTQTFFTAFARATLHEAFWATEEFWFFGLGVVLWMVIFFGLPKLLLPYVFGHELTHAVSVLIMGGKVHRFHVSREGGHILATKTNTWIALAPYFFPIYSALVIAIYGIAGMFTDMTPYNRWLYALIGLTWAFHLSFTLWMIPKGQPDLTYGGTFFSLVFIYILNLALLAVMLIFASPGITLMGFGMDLIHNTADFARQVTWGMTHILTWRTTLG